MAQLLVVQKYEAEDALRADPGSCPRCRGSGYQGSGRFTCGCPLAEARSRNRTLEQDARDRFIDDRPAVPATIQHSLF
jgi:hypothetical protein